MGRTTNTARRRTEANNARERAAAARATAAKRERRRRLLVVLGTSLGVLAVVAVIIVVGISSSGKKADTSRVPAPATLVAQVTGVPSTTINTVGAGTTKAFPKAINDSALTANGHPEVLFIGAEFCPYCAAERWSLVEALSRFGSFSGLTTIHSSPTDVYPNTATFSFYGSSYTSTSISYVSREDETVTGAQLQPPTAAENALWKKYTGQGSFPFVDIGGRYVITGPSYDPAVLKGLTAAQIAADLADPTNAVAKAVDGTANVITAAICKTTSGEPIAVCTAPGVTTAAKALGG